MNLLNKVKVEIHQAKDPIKYAMNNFLYTVGISYIPLHQEALEVAKSVGPVEVKWENKKSTIHNAYENIIKDVNKGRLGFKRKYVRC